VQPFAVNDVDSPKHNVLSLQVTNGLFGTPTVTDNVSEDLLEQSPILQIAEYLVDVDGVVTNSLPTKPVDHVTVPAHSKALKVTDAPGQINSELQTIVGIEGLPTTIETGTDVGLIQFATLQTAEYVVVTFGFTVILVPVLPFDQITSPVPHPVAL